jgi:hypothetical protein
MALSYPLDIDRADLRRCELAMECVGPAVIRTAGQLPTQKVGCVAAKDARPFKKLPPGKAGEPRKLKSVAPRNIP